jgi:hypothetical protein
MTELTPGELLLLRVIDQKTTAWDDTDRAPLPIGLYTDSDYAFNSEDRAIIRSLLESAPVESVPAPRLDHVMKVGFDNGAMAFRLTCNLDYPAKCHQVCQTHLEGGCGEPETEGECDIKDYETCVIAEWVNDGGIESVLFEFERDIPVSYYWDGAHNFPILVAAPPVGTQP